MKPVPLASRGPCTVCRETPAGVNALAIKRGRQARIALACALACALAVSTWTAQGAPAAAAPAAPPSRPASAAILADLPLVELPAQDSAADYLAIVLTGDGGWAGLGKGVGMELSRRGIPVVGWNSLRYFWEARTPEGAARDLEAVIEHYVRAWGKSRVMLVGYSQGADTLPFMINRLPQSARQRIESVAIIAISNEAMFEFHVAQWVGASAGAIPTAPELERLGSFACIYAVDDAADSPCRTLHKPGVRVVALPGGHHFEHDYATVADAVLGSHQ